MSKLLQVALAAAVTAAGLGALPATADPEPGVKQRTPCPFVRSIDNFQHVDDRTAIIWTSPRKSYKITFFGTCRELKWSHFARVESRPGICLSRGDAIVVGHRGFRDRCIVDRIEALPPKGEAQPTAY